MALVGKDQETKEMRRAYKLWYKTLALFNARPPKVIVIEIGQVKKLGVPLSGPDMLTCPGNWTGPCTRRAGVPRGYPGIGHCYDHIDRDGDLKAIMIMAHAFSNANELRKIHITPAEALLEECARTNNIVRYLDNKILSVDDTDHLLKEGRIEHEYWKWWKEERAHGLRAAVAAKTACALEIVEEQQSEIAKAILENFYTMVDALDLNEERRAQAEEYLKNKMLEIEKGEGATSKKDIVDNFFSKIPY